MPLAFLQHATNCTDKKITSGRWSQAQRNYGIECALSGNAYLTVLRLNKRRRIAVLGPEFPEPDSPPHEEFCKCNAGVH